MKLLKAINVRLAIFTLFFLVVFVNLGFWQLDRAAEKQAQLEDQLAKARFGPVDIRELLGQPVPEGVNGLPVLMAGQYDPDPLLLLDNVVLDGTVGYEVLVPFHVEGTAVRVLVNRGFVAMPRTRDKMPEVPAVRQGKALIGQVYVRSGTVPLQPAPVLDDVYIVQSADIEGIGALTGDEYFSHMVRLDENDMNALPRFWPLSNMTPEKHTGYAVQWFLMSLVLLGFFVYFTVSSYRRDDNGDAPST